MRVHVILLTAICLSWSSLEADDYNYPYHDPYVATVTTAILNGEGDTPRLKRQVLHVPGLAGRNRLPSLEGRGELSVAFYRQRHPAPLLFILSGIGSNPYFGLATYFARLFYQEGSHVVILPSPMSWNFALAASRSGAPGYSPEDARDLYEVMQKTLSILRTRYGLDVLEINFLGASLGALEGAHLSVIDATERKIGIKKYLLVNPPLDLAYAVKKIDEWHALTKRFGKNKSDSVLASALAVVESFSTERRDDPAVFDRLAKAFGGFTTEELQFLIAEDLRALLPELVYVMQVLHHQNVLPATRDQTRKRLEDAKDVPRADLESFTTRGSLASILDRLRGNANVQIMHNADDVIADRKSIQELKAALGDQVTLYPYGGHLGNLWYSENKEYVLRYFSAEHDRRSGSVDPDELAEDARLPKLPGL